MCVVFDDTYEEDYTLYICVWTGGLEWNEQVGLAEYKGTRRVGGSQMRGEGVRPVAVTGCLSSDDNGSRRLAHRGSSGQCGPQGVTHILAAKLRHLTRCSS